MLLSILGWSGATLVGMGVACKLFKYRARWKDFNTTYNGHIDDNHRLYLNYKELKNVYLVNENRWFWCVPEFSWCTKAQQEVECLWFDSDENPHHGVHEYVSYSKQYRKSVYKVFLTFPAWVLAMRYKKDKSGRELKKKLMDKDAVYLENKQVMIKSLKGDIKAMEEQAKIELEQARKMMEEACENMKKGCL